MRMTLHELEVLKKAESLVDNIRRECKGFVPHLAHFFLLSTFLEDGFRMAYQWGFQRDYMDSTWNCGFYWATLFVLINFLTQLCGALMIGARYRVKLACVFLGFSVVLQTCAYTIFRDRALLIRFFSLAGSLLLLYADEHTQAKRLLPGVPSLGIDHPKSYMQLTGRILVAFLFVTTIRIESSIVHILQDLVAAVMMTLVAVGYKTRLSAIVLAAWLFAVNIHLHPFWNIEWNLPERENLKYEFFQNLSVIGGLLLIVSRGPGDMSVDERKKLY